MATSELVKQGPPDDPTGRWQRTRTSLAGSRTVTIFAALAVIVVFFSATQESFLTQANLNTLLTSVAALWMLSLGLTFVLILGGFDLSIGSMMALSGFVLYWIYVDLSVPIWLAVILTIVVCATLGGIANGFLIGRLRASFMVVTLGTLSLFRGLVNLVSDTTTKPVDSSFLDQVAYSAFAGIPILVLLMIGAFLVAWWVLRSTFFGRDVYAVGGNPQAARLSGIRVVQVTILVYAISAGAAAIGGVIQVSRIAAASPLVGDTIMFDAAAAVLLGGTALRGGSGGVTGTIAGVLFLGTLANGLAISGVPSYWQQILSGLIVASAAVGEVVQREGLRSLELVPRRRNRASTRAS